MNILILGAGAREHAFAYALSRSPTVHKIYACPGNAGMKDICTRLPFSSNSDLINLVKDRVELAVVGSPKYIELGTVDALTRAGIPVIGPAADAGRIETSKAFAAKFIARHNIPAPFTHVVANRAEAEAFIHENPWVGVVKCDGFAAGTGVAVVDSPDEAIGAVHRLLKTHGPPLILQERLQGLECSFAILTDGQQWISFSSCRDYKKVGEHDEGPTTGGMGAVSPCPGLTREVEAEIQRRIVEPTVAGLRADKLSYHGFLSFQLMLTTRGPKVLEFNARLGDPEAQSILARFRGNLADLLLDCARGRLESLGSEVAFGRHFAVSVVLARQGYPLDESAQPRITGYENVRESMIMHSGSEIDPGSTNFRFSGGRLVTLTALGDTLEQARHTCYDDIRRLDLTNVMCRQDIGLA